MNYPTENIIVDSDMTREEIVAQNPKSPAPQDIVTSQEILEVKYYSFDNKLHSGQIVVNKDVAKDILDFFNLALEIKFPIERVVPISNEKYKWDDQVSCDDNNSSGYNYRLVMGTTRMSKHSSGKAFDINPVQNIYVRYDKYLKEIFKSPTNGLYDRNVLGTLTNDHPLVNLMKDLGWNWGGDWTPESGRIDYQHFEKNI